KIIKSDPNKILSALNDFPGGRDLYSRYSTAMDAISALKTHELPLNLVEPARLLNSIDKEFLMARFSLTADQLNNILLNPDQAAARHMYNEIVQTEWQAFATFGSNLEASQFQLSIKSALQQDGLIPVSIHTHPTVSTDDIIALSPSPGDYHQYRVNSDGLMFSADGTETSYLFNMIVAGKPNKYTVVNVLSGTEHVPTEIPIGEDLDKLFGNNYVFGTEYTNGVPISHLEFPGGNPSTINSVKDISIRPLAGPSLRLPGNWLSKESGKVGTELNGPLGRSSSRLLGLVGALGIATSIVAGPEIAQASETESEIPLSEKVPGYSSLLDPDVPEEVISSALDQAALFVNAELVDKMAQIFFDQNNVYSSSLETKAGQKLIEVSGNSVSSRFTQQAQIFNQDLLNLAEEGKEIPTEKLNKLNIVRKFLELKGQEIKLLDKLPEEHVCNDVATPPSGEQGTYEQEWEMGTNKGEFTLKYNFYKQPDKIDIYYENNPKSIFSSEGFVSCDRTKGLQNKPTDYQCNTIDIYHGGPTSGGLGQLNKQECDTFGLPNSAYPHKISFPQGGTSTKVKAVVTAPCGTTAWVYKISCPQGVKQPPKLSNFYILSSNIYSDGLRKAALKTLLESGEAIGGTDTNSDAYIKNSTIFFKNLLRFGTDKQIKDFVKNKATNILTYFGAVINKLQSKISGDLYQTVYENSHIIDLLGILISENSAARTQSINIVKKLLSTGRGVYSDSKLIDLIIESFALETYESGKLTVIDSIPVTLLSNEKMFQFISGIVEDKNGYYRDQLLLKDVAINILTASGDPRAIEIIKDLSKKDEIKFAQSGTALNIVPVSVPPTIETNQQLNIQLFIPESNKDIKKIDTVDSIVKSDTGISSVTMVETGPNTGVFVFGTPVHIVDSRCSSGGPGCPQTGVRIVSTSGEDVRIFIGGSDVSVGVGSQEIESPFIDPKLLPIVRLFESSSASTLGSVKDKRIIVYVQDVPVAGDIRTISFGKSDFPNKRNGESVKKEIILGANGFVSSIDYSLTSVGECLVSLSCSWCGIKITSCQDEYASSEVKLYKDGKEIDSKKTGRLGHDKQATDIGSFTFNKFADKIEVIFNKEDDAGDYENLGLSITANTYSQAVNVKGREVFSLATQDGKITTALFGEIPNPTTKIIILKSLLEDIRQLPALQVQSAILNAVASKAIITLDENNQDAFKNKDILNLFSDIYGPLGVGDIKPGETKRIDNFQGWSGTLNVLVYDGVSIPGMINNGDTLRFVVPDSATYKGVIITLKGYPTGSCIVKPDKLPRGFETGESTIADCNRVVLPTGEKSKVLEFSGIETKGFVPEKDSSEITKIVFGCRDVKPSQNPIFSFKQGTTHTINGKEYTFYGNVLDEAILLYSKGYLTASPIVGFPSKVDGMVFRVTNFKKDSDGIPSFDLEVGGKEQPDIGTVFSECSEEGQLGCTSISKTIHKCLGGQNIITQQCDYGCNKWADNLLPECNKQPERKEKYSIYRIYNMPQTNLYSNYKTEFSAPHHFNLTTAYVMAFSSVRNDWIELLMIAPRDKGITETSPGYYTIEKQLSNQVESLDIDSSKGFYWVFGGYLVNYKGNLASLNGVPKQSCVGASGLEYSCEQRNAIPSYPYIRENPIKWGPNAMSNTNLVGNFKVKGDGQIVTYQGSKYKFGNTNNNKAILEIDGQRYEFDPGIPKTIGNKIVTVKDFFNYVYYPYDLNYMEVETSDPPSAPSSLSLIQFTPTNPPQPTKAAFQLALYTQGLPINKDITATSCVDQTVRLNEITTGIILKSLSETGGKATIYYTETPTKVPQVITTVAGRGEQGNSGDGGLAVDSTLGYIKGIGTDKNGNLFIADAYVYNVDNSVNSDVVHSYKIRMVNRSTGIISTVAGISKRIDAATTTVVGGHIESFSGDGGPADKAELKYPNDVAVDKDGNIYIADTNNQRIRKIDKKGIITTIAGTGERCNKPPQQCGDSGPATQALLDAPKRIAVDKDGNVYITSGLRVKKLKPEGTGYTISAIAGTGQPCGPLNPCGDNGIADQAQLGSISGLWINRDGDIYIADSGARRIRKVVGTTKIITSVASMQGDPIGIAGDQNGNIYTAYGISAAGSTVIKKGESGLIATIAGTGERCSPSTGFCGDNGPADNSQISSVEDLEVDTYGNIYVADQQSYKIRKISPQSQRAISPISAGDSFGPDPFFAGVSTANQVIEEKIETLYFSGEQIKIFGLDRKIAITRIIFGCSTEGLGGGNPTFSAYLINNTEKTQAIFDLNRVELTDCEEKEIQINSEPIDSIEINSLISSGGRAKIYYKETRTRVQPSPSPSPSSTAPTPTVIVNGNCADSDGGQNSFIKGITTYENGRILTDYCFNPTYVEEGYCDQTGNAKIISVGCISGCEDGACKRTVGECSDSDGGHEYYVKGETYGDSPSTNLPYKSYDTCDSTGQLIEHYCDSNRYHTNIVYNCPNKCLDGACVRSTGPIIKTIAGVGELCRSPTDPCGDNSSAISAKLNLINLVVDSSGNIYLSSYNKIRKIDKSTGIITTIAGTGAAGFSGDG
ncbi:MAG TPA: hypothetical protein VJA47_04335, partial [archaeon]|nr:hypothetical protein [archaeon]